MSAHDHASSVATIPSPHASLSQGAAAATQHNRTTRLPRDGPNHDDTVTQRGLGAILSPARKLAPEQRKRLRRRSDELKAVFG
jgi:hypothetical protein